MIAATIIFTESRSDFDVFLDNVVLTPLGFGVGIVSVFVIVLVVWALSWLFFGLVYEVQRSLDL